MKIAGKLIIIFVVSVFLSGCITFGWSSKKNYILSETESYYLIPAGTPFNAVVIKGEEPIEVVRDKDTWAVDAGYLVELQEEANEKTLELK